MEYSKALRTAINAAEAAGAVITSYLDALPSTNLKADLTPVTEADIKAEQAVAGTLRKVFPHHRILGEELGETPGDLEHLWIIDPIDGTKHFARGIPLFATQIALMRAGELVLGVSNAPCLNELVYAEDRRGAYANHRRIRVSDTTDLTKAYLSFGNIKHFASCNLLTSVARLAAVCWNARGIGDAWSYHLLAQGKIDIMIDAKTEIWDIAAATTIVKEAGGTVTDLQGAPIGLASTSILATNGHLHCDVLELLNTHGSRRETA